MENLPAQNKASYILVDALLGQIDVVYVVHAVLYNTSTIQYSGQGSTRRVTGPGMKHAHQQLTDDDHDAEWSEEDGNQRTGGHQTRASPQRQTPSLPN